MILFLQAVTRLVTLVLLVVLALAGLAVAVFSVPNAESGLSELADLIGLHLARDEVGAFLGALEGSPAVGEVAICFSAVLLGALLVAGALLRKSERSVELAPAGDGEPSGPAGRLAARRRAVTQVGAALAGRVREADSLRVRVRPRPRSPGGRLRVRAALRDGGDADATAERIAKELKPLTESFSLRPRIRARSARGDSQRPAARPADGDPAVDRDRSGS